MVNQHFDGAVMWGDIIGTLSNQTDLTAALNGGGGTPGPQGPPGPDGPPGPKGDPGTPGASTWGSLTGTLSAQTDLQTALNGKAAVSHTHAPSDITGTAVVTADARLSDARTPLAHTHPQSDITNLVTALAAKEPANANIQTHIASAHAPANAQKNSDITKAEIEAVLTGAISSHTHSKSDVGLGSVDNTADTAKPVSTATQTALNLKANLVGPTLTGLTIADATDVTISSTTGSKIGQAGSKIGLFGVQPVVRPSALTQTYSTTSATHAAMVSAAAPAGGTGTAAGGYNTAANRDLMIATINNLRTDVINLKNFVNQLVDQLQALGALQ